jgi:hypothetical protein
MMLGQWRHLVRRADSPQWSSSSPLAGRPHAQMTPFAFEEATVIFSITPPSPRAA